MQETVPEPATCVICGRQFSVKKYLNYHNLFKHLDSYRTTKEDSVDVIGDKTALPFVNKDTNSEVMTTFQKTDFNYEEYDKENMPVTVPVAVNDSQNILNEKPLTGKSKGSQRRKTHTIDFKLKTVKLFERAKGENIKSKLMKEDEN